MGFGHLLLRAVVFGTPATAHFDGQPQLHQSLVERPAGCIHGCRVAQGCPRPCQDVRQPLGIMRQEHPDVLCPFGCVARHAGQRQITFSAAPPTAAGSNVFHLQRDARHSTIRASVLPFHQQVFPGLASGERPLLILDALDAWRLQRLRVKSHQLQRERRDGAEPAQPLDPGHHVLYPTPLGGRQPAAFPAPVGKPRLSVAGMALPAASARRSPLAQPLHNRRPQVPQFCRPHHLVRLLIHERQAGGLAPRIDLQPESLRSWPRHRPFQDDGERVALEHRRLACFE